MSTQTIPPAQPEPLAACRGCGALTPLSVFRRKSRQWYRCDACFKAYWADWAARHKAHRRRYNAQRKPRNARLAGKRAYHRVKQLLHGRIRDNNLATLQPYRSQRKGILGEFLHRPPEERPLAKKMFQELLARYGERAAEDPRYRSILAACAASWSARTARGFSNAELSRGNSEWGRTMQTRRKILRRVRTHWKRRLGLLPLPRDSETGAPRIPNDAVFRGDPARFFRLPWVETAEPTSDRSLFEPGE